MTKCEQKKVSVSVLHMHILCNKHTLNHSVTKSVLYCVTTNLQFFELQVLWVQAFVVIWGVCCFQFSTFPNTEVHGLRQILYQTLDHRGNIPWLEVYVPLEVAEISRNLCDSLSSICRGLYPPYARLCKLPHLFLQC